MINRLFSFLECGLEVTPSTILYGLRRFKDYERLITCIQVSEFLLENIQQARPTNIPEEMSIRLLANDNDLSATISILQDAVSEKPRDDSDEYLKWVAVLLYTELSAIVQNPDPVYNICDLNSFWGMLEYPMYSHHLLCDEERYITDKSGERHSRSEYFSSASRDKIIGRHCDWLEMTLRELGGLMPVNFRMQMQCNRGDGPMT